MRWRRASLASRRSTTLTNVQIMLRLIPSCRPTLNRRTCAQIFAHINKFTAKCFCKKKAIDPVGYTRVFPLVTTKNGKCRTFRLITKPKVLVSIHFNVKISFYIMALCSCGGEIYEMLLDTTRVVLTINLNSYIGETIKSMARLQYGNEYLRKIQLSAHRLKRWEIPKFSYHGAIWRIATLETR